MKYLARILVVYLGKLCQLRLQVSFHPNFAMLLDFCLTLIYVSSKIHANILDNLDRFDQT